MTTAIISLMLMTAPSNYAWMTPEIYLYTQYYAGVNHLSPALVRAVIHAESTGRPDAVSRCGAIGLMQVMPFHVKHPARLYDVRYNIEIGCGILRDCMVASEGNVRLALKKYNAGPNYLKYHKRWPKSTLIYVAKIIKNMEDEG
jgi:soluble lytic murein transglycosylase-like protein